MSLEYKFRWTIFTFYYTYILSIIVHQGAFSINVSLRFELNHILIISIFQSVVAYDFNTLEFLSIAKKNVLFSRWAEMHINQLLVETINFSLTRRTYDHKIHFYWLQYRYRFLFVQHTHSQIQTNCKIGVMSTNRWFIYMAWWKFTINTQY